MGHVAEHVALQLQQTVGHDMRRGKTRQVKGERGRYNVIYAYYDESVGLAAGELAVRLVNHLIVPDPGFDFDEALERFIVRGERTAFGPSTQAIVEEAVSRDIPYLRLNTASLVQLGQGVHQKRIRATMTSQTPVGCGRHRQQQGAHPDTAVGGRASGSSIAVGPYPRRRASDLPTALAIP